MLRLLITPKNSLKADGEKKRESGGGKRERKKNPDTDASEIGKLLILNLLETGNILLCS